MRKIFVSVGVIVGLLVATSIQSLAQDDLLGFCMHDQTGIVRLDTECTRMETPYYLPSENIVQALVPAGTIVMWSGAIEGLNRSFEIFKHTIETLATLQLFQELSHREVGDLVGVIAKDLRQHLEAVLAERRGSVAHGQRCTGVRRPRCLDPGRAAGLALVAD